MHGSSEQYLVMSSAVYTASVGWSSPRTTEDQEKDQDWTAKDQDHTVVFVSPVLVLVLVLCTFKFCRTTQDQSGPVLDWSI